MKMSTILPLVLIISCGSQQTNKPRHRHRYPPNEFDRYADQIPQPRATQMPIATPKPTATKTPVDQSPIQHPKGTYFRCQCYNDGWSEGLCDYSNSSVTHVVRFIFAADWPAYFLPADKCKIIW